MYDELLAALQALKANVENESTKQAVQTVYDNVIIFLNFLKQRDGQQLPDASLELANSIMRLYQTVEINGHQSFQDFLYSIDVQIKRLHGQQCPNEPYAEALNKIIVDFKNGLITYLSGGC